jgi:MOSC domain-containing protein
MKIAGIWRYPVKSMAGERVDSIPVDANGLEGDRVVQVYDRRGRLATARTFPRLLRLKGTLGSDGEPLVDGYRWDSPQAGERVAAAVEPGARLRRFNGPERFDVLPLLVCTDTAVEAFGRDVRRLRPNLLIEGVGDGGEREWAGATLRLPGTAIRLADPRARCVMTTYDPDTIAQDTGVLRDIVRRFDGRLCLNAHVMRKGCVREGDWVEVDTAHPG